MNPSWSGAGGDRDLQVLWEDGERVFCRGESHVDGYPVSALVVLPAAEHPTPAALDRLACEYGLKNELDAAWAVRPIELVRERGRTMLVLEDTRGEPLNRLLGMPMGGAELEALVAFMQRNLRTSEPVQTPDTVATFAASAIRSEVVARRGGTALCSQQEIQPSSVTEDIRIIRPLR